MPNNNNYCVLKEPVLPLTVLGGRRKWAIYDKNKTLVAIKNIKKNKAQVLFRSKEQALSAKNQIEAGDTQLISYREGSGLGER